MSAPTSGRSSEGRVVGVDGGPQGVQGGDAGAELAGGVGAEVERGQLTRRVPRGVMQLAGADDTSSALLPFDEVDRRAAGSGPAERSGDASVHVLDAQSRSTQHHRRLRHTSRARRRRTADHGGRRLDLDDHLRRRLGHSSIREPSSPNRASASPVPSLIISGLPSS